MLHFSSEFGGFTGSPTSAQELLYWLVRERRQFEHLVRSLSIDEASEPGWSWPVRGLPMDDLIVLDFDGGDDGSICL
jgi:hypothetical protein